MRCPFCGQDKDKVVDSRSSEGGVAIRRRRECLACQKRFTTYEHVEEITKLTVVKRDGSRVPFDKSRMLAGLESACYKRPVPTKLLHQIVDEVAEELVRLGEREVDSLDIGERLSQRLRQVDQVAYVRFASVYKQFRDLDELLAEVRDVISSTDPRSPPSQGKLF